MQEFIPPRTLLPHEPIEKAVYCAECELFNQKIIGCKEGKCLEHPITDSTMPLVCNYYKNAHKIVSILVFLKSGISVYNKAIVEDLESEIDPSLLSSFLQAISSFGQELTNEQVSLIEFQKMNIVFCRGKYSSGAMIVRGKIDDHSKECFSYFINKLENSYPQFFAAEYPQPSIPEKEIDKIAVKALKEYAMKRSYPINAEIIENICTLGCGVKKS